MVGKTGGKAIERRVMTPKRRISRSLRTNDATSTVSPPTAEGWNATIDEHLARTYFRTRNAPPPVTVPRRRSPLLVASVSLFTCVIGVWVVLGPVHRLVVSTWGQTKPVTEFVELFDHPSTAPRVGVWLSAPGDTTQGCRLSYSQEHRVGTTGNGLVVDYDVDSPHPATVGVWLTTTPAGRDVAHGALSFFISGDTLVGYSETCVIELQTARGRSRYYLDGITENWKQAVIPWEYFVPAPDLATLHDVVLLFEDWNVTKKQGRIYLDDVRFTTTSSDKPVGLAAKLPQDQR